MQSTNLHGGRRNGGGRNFDTIIIRVDNIIIIVIHCDAASVRARRQCVGGVHNGARNVARVLLLLAEACCANGHIHRRIIMLVLVLFLLLSGHDTSWMRRPTLCKP